MRPGGENLVNDRGQLYTIEGVAAAILILVTIYIVLGTTIIYTPGDSHINDLQLEQVGSDALAMMDTPTQYNEPASPTLADAYLANQSNLEKYIMTYDKTGFNSTFFNYINSQHSGLDHLNYTAIVYFRNTTGIFNYTFYQSAMPTGREHFVRVTRLVTLSGIPILPSPAPTVNARWQTVLLDVLIWRD
jgi:hypothetical protein